jgi:ubiquinone/menaquinone biosynthesis C-methylase UbiE
MAKDLFSGHASLYAKYRPRYPKEFIEYIVSFVEEKNKAWDCATGNGQAATMIAEHFKEVHATDLSASQLSQAEQRSNVFYQQSPAENVPFKDNEFDLITVATAYHWLNWKAFYDEATRVGKNNAVVAVWCYYTLEFEEPDMTTLYQHFYKDITGPYWEKERRFVDERYQTVEFDFDPLPVKEFGTRLEWTKEEFKGYLETWSAVQTYIRTHGRSPVDLISNELDRIWNNESKKQVYFPLCLRLGRIKKHII